MNAIPHKLRNDFLDRIRILLTVLVILHHTAIMFGGDGGWYLRYAATSKLSQALLTLFAAVNQSFFMGAFFLLAGYFTPRSIDSKGLFRFSVDRLARLGIPVLIYGFFIGPLTIALANTPANSTVMAEWWRLVANFTFNIGPLWFAYALLIFSLAYVLLKLLFAKVKWELSTASLCHINILLLCLTWGAGAFLLRLWVPTGQEFGMLQVGYFSSYILLFALGCASAKMQLLERIEGQLAKLWGWISLLTIPSLFIYAALSGAFDGAPFELHGGWTLPVVVYAFWEPFVACGILLMLLWRSRIAKQSWSFLTRLAPLCYGAFIIHAPIVVSLGLLLSSWQVSGLLKFVCAGAIAALLSFILASLLIRLPGARRIL
jgi:hypothetical protein